jgi:hypothetical protein
MAGALIHIDNNAAENIFFKQVSALRADMKKMRELIGQLYESVL